MELCCFAGGFRVSAGRAGPPMLVQYCTEKPVRTSYVGVNLQ